MRIIGGKFRGQKLFLPKTPKTRPLSDLAREALFNLLGDIQDLRVLDAYAGSGAVGLEALSRGAASVTGIEIAREPAAKIEKNIKQLGVEDRYTLITEPIEKWLKSAGRVKAFDLIYAGPPYGAAEIQIATELSDLLTDDGLLILETSRREGALQSPVLELIDSRNYGESVLSFYKRKR